MTFRPEIKPATTSSTSTSTRNSAFWTGSRARGEITQRAADLGMKALAVTDHGAMYGTIELCSAAKAAGINPIIGIEQYIAQRGVADKEGKQDADYYRMVLMAENNVGYRNVLALTTAALLDGYYYKPRIAEELGSYHRIRPEATSRITYPTQIATRPQVSTAVAGPAKAGRTEPSVRRMGPGKSASAKAVNPKTITSAIGDKVSRPGALLVSRQSIAFMGYSAAVDAVSEITATPTVRMPRHVHQFIAPWPRTPDTIDASV